MTSLLPLGGVREQTFHVVRSVEDTHVLSFADVFHREQENNEKADEQTLFRQLYDYYTLVPYRWVWIAPPSLRYLRRYISHAYVQPPAFKLTLRLFALRRNALDFVAASAARAS